MKSNPGITVIKQNASNVMEKTLKEEGQSRSNSEDSDDDKPLSHKLSSGALNGNSHHIRMGSNLSCPSPYTSPKPRIIKGPEDEMLLSSELQLNAGASNAESSDSDESKPLASELEDPSSSLNKRPLIQPKNSDPSPSKKAKLSEPSAPTNRKLKTAEQEEAAADDDPSISNRNKKSTTPASKVSDKKKRPDVSASVNKVDFSKSLKVPLVLVKGRNGQPLVHNGVIFPPLYKPHGVKMLYRENPVDLTPEQEEVATMFAVMLETEYMTKPKFRENFMSDWRKILGEKHIIQNLEDCDFTPIYEWHQREKEKKKQMSTDEKKAIKEGKDETRKEKYMWAVVDGMSREKVGNFRVGTTRVVQRSWRASKDPQVKKNVYSQIDITINIGKDAPIPEPPIPGERWKEIRHDNTVTWLAFWNDPINPKEFKYVFLAASSSLKGKVTREKYEKSRKLKDYIEGIRAAAYTKDFASKDSKKRQIAVATYLIDKLALRAGNEKDDDEADTVGCCTLKVENVETKRPNILKFDFLGKDSIRYQNEVEVEPRVFSAIEQFRSGKEGGDDLFDQLDTSKLNAHLKELMPGLTAKVFRTYNASITLDEMVRCKLLSRETKGGDVAEKVVVYQHANKEVAIICNHQRTVSKSHSAQMVRLNEKIEELKGLLKELQEDLTRVNKGKPPLKNSDGKPKRNLNLKRYKGKLLKLIQKLRKWSETRRLSVTKKIAQTNTKIEKMERDKETKEDLKTVALGTSKINYLDPRITVAWCKRHDVPIEKIFNKSLLAKFAWAMDVVLIFRF
uniref:DNA topoisomerase 1 n=1 Tax=Daucus carota TaxID=4039 RepID=TOP1_DAUCA|nr:RecName: Full=DNA topoisomerase 1; AltName: Full=DNA topoisomerase I [Daucus carota]AAB41401.1 topoisomerase I [Daucus carota]